MDDSSHTETFVIDVFGYNLKPEFEKKIDDQVLQVGEDIVVFLPDYFDPNTQDTLTLTFSTSPDASIFTTFDPEK